MNEIQKIKKYIKDNYQSGRYRHTMGVWGVIKRLAKHAGVNIRKAEIAALLHDIGRGHGKERKLDYDMYEKINPDLRHSKLSWYYSRQLFNITEKDVLDAILYHTTGKKRMSDLLKILFIADFMEPSRKHNTEYVRKIVRKGNITLACLEIMKMKFKYIIQRNFIIHPRTVEAYNHLLFDDLVLRKAY